ncbi:YhcN/YlaJ family sporulation lipoprotein [Paenibacillus sp. WST5]|uniref:YhcN/YlaJ family sporulation lipoprotein n=2 Tax=Paenibacillus sedimenti TaxID=2770274 RepID=A0A926KRG5_9BACL|nr:YhcN/YlaJ family sporulation lipoprotein [Paenibacillus sedimenti]
MMIATGCTVNNANDDQVRQQGTQQGTHIQQDRNQDQDQANGNNDNRVQVAQQAADKLTQLNGIRQANVLVTRRNAYVAAGVDTNQTQLTPDLENQIAQQVKSTDPNIQNVYVSTNPEFVDRVNTYVADVGQGRPVAGFFEQFNDMVQRIFPNAR